MQNSTPRPGRNNVLQLALTRLILALLFTLPSIALAQLAAPNLALSNLSDGIGLRWSAVSNASGYRLYYAPYPYQGPDSADSMDVGNVLEIAGDLPQLSAFYVAVIAYNEQQSSEFSNIEYFIVDERHLNYDSDVGSFNGLTLIAPISSNATYLIDDFGNIKHQWQSDTPPRLSTYLLANGNLLRSGNVSTGFFDSGGKGGLIEELDWDGNLVWHFEYSDDVKSLHHDIEPLPNGNVLALSWELRDDLWSEVIAEISKLGSDAGEVVWRWDVFDHLDELGLDSSSATSEDWIHLNSIDFNHASRQILLSSRSHNQLWVINKDDGSVAATSSVMLTGQHDAKWIDDQYASSNITVFDNGSSFSRALEIDSTLQTIIFSYGNADSEFFYSPRISGTQRLANGNTLICSGVGGLIIELDSAGNKIREVVNSYGGASPKGTVTDIFRAEKYATGFTAYF